MADTIGDLLQVIAFILTIIIIILSIIRGLDKIELWLNVLYFVTLNITFLEYIYDKIIKKIQL